MENQINQSKSIKILLFGDCLTGKSSLLIRYFQDKFYDYPNYYGIEFYQKLLKRGKEEIKIQLWDFHSNERMYYISQFLYRTFSFVIICYDVTNRKSFQKAYNWYLNFKNNQINNKLMVLSLIGNKCDLQEELRQVSYQEGQQLAQSLGMVFFEASAKTGYQVKELFDFIIEQTLNIN
ncbi:Ras family small GTPase (macronuclear) [Tetrahymena thermophila SB210]|uniref:Ras family small GTPase n=1 Tax=Tetrahymena thermophila (strain SB210) TaxID=312017 RepID=W7XKM6_TETTS|nr:Ras family small GTPase [Tetrahymena thermophila SB210]EWS76656.1 Ras family small GTPase [Tetrahymena thermophila SB210]|eukprot:XP_012650824.1 Ras family small GTPase [Tetrahymena thermophila SB210]